MKVGLGLWNHPAVALALDVRLLAGGSVPTSQLGTYGFWVFCTMMVLIQAWVFFGPPPTSDVALAVTALVFYAMFAGVAGWLERHRRN